MENLNSHQLTKTERRLLERQEKEREQIQRASRKKLRKIALIAGSVVIFAGTIVLALFFVPKNGNQDNRVKITIYKSPTCSCCEEYITYLKNKDFRVEVVNTQDMLSIKEKYQIPPEMESCHTSVIGDYFIEGHMPVEAIQKLLEERPQISGIALPGMPAGSPGMGGGIKKDPFEIQALTNGQMSEFMTIK